MAWEDGKRSGANSYCLFTFFVYHSLEPGRKRREIRTFLSPFPRFSLLALRRQAATGCVLT